MMTPDHPENFLPVVRRLEAVGFRAWPAASVTWDGSWQFRMTPGHPSRRLNGIVPLDPGDTRDIAGRIDRAVDIFAEAGATMSVRQSPLCPPQLTEYLAHQGWTPDVDTLVMTGDLDHIDPSPSVELLPTQDANLFAEACLAIDLERETSREVLTKIIGAIVPPHGLFIMHDETGQPIGTTLAVADNDLAGISQVVVAQNRRRSGLGRNIVSASLRWARLKNARQAWLQVKAKNDAAIALYTSMGFSERYRYCYWSRPE